MHDNNNHTLGRLGRLLGLALIALLLGACGGGSGGEPRAGAQLAGQPAGDLNGGGKAHRPHGPPPAPGQGGAAPTPMLVLYDTGGPYGYVGVEYAIMLENLLGHFNADVTLLPVEQYTAGTLDRYTRIFYIGSTYDDPSHFDSGSPEALAYDQFLTDAANTGRTLTWLNYNLWHFVQKYEAIHGADSFRQRFGFSYQYIVNNSYNRVRYKGVELYKGVVVHANPGAVLTGCEPEGDGKYDCALEANYVAIEDPARAEVLATTYSSTFTSAQEIPYFVRGGNLWYIGDIPFSFFSEEDRYLAFADVLHDITESGIPRDAVPQYAIARFEDVSPGIDVADLDAAMALMQSKGVPFAVATIPIYKDPLNVIPDDGGDYQTLPGSAVGKSLKKYFRNGYASIIHHGTTHQWDGGPNPYNQLTGDDFEFFRVTMNADYSLNFLGAVSDDSADWARSRMEEGNRLLRKAGLRPFAWEAPHYMASETDYRTIQQIYPVHYGRMLYTNPQRPDRYIGQFFPYVIEKDHYGYRQVPESIGNIEPEPFQGYRQLLPPDLLRHAEKLKVVRDGVASFFYHPHLGTDYLTQVVDGLRAAGYDFVAPCSLALYCP